MTPSPQDRDEATARGIVAGLREDLTLLVDVQDPRWLNVKEHELIAAIAQALREKRERDCMAVCWCCNHPELWKPASYNEDVQMVGHTHVKEPTGFSKCDAAALRQQTIKGD